MAPRKLPTSPSAGLKFVPLTHIHVLPQVRTKPLDQDKLAELAASIKAHGLMQPIVLRPAEAADEYYVVAGHRRYAAVKLNGDTEIPALIIKTDGDGVLLKQLAENIHREDFKPSEIAAAVAELYTAHGTVQAVADVLKKSKAWVSKYLAASREDFGHVARKLLMEGTVEDLEILGCVSQIEKLAPASENLETIVNALKQGKANRQDARDMLDKVKSEISPVPNGGHMPIKVGPIPAAHELEAVIKSDSDAWLVFQSWPVDKQNEVRNSLETYMVEAIEARKVYAGDMVWFARLVNERAVPLMIATYAFALGGKFRKIDTEAIVKIAQAIYKPAPSSVPANVSQAKHAANDEPAKVQK